MISTLPNTLNISEFDVEFKSEIDSFLDRARVKGMLKELLSYIEHHPLSLGLNTLNMMNNITPLNIMNNTTELNSLKDERMHQTIAFY